jgi:hypothetical protein
METIEKGKDETSLGVSRLSSFLGVADDAPQVRRSPIEEAEKNVSCRE